MVRVYVAAALVLLTACTGNRATELPTPTVSPSVGDPEQLVETVVVREGDVPRTTVRLIKGGAKVEGQVTLDECGFSFSSEARRVARRQVGVAFPGDKGSYSAEVVAYVTEDAARNAMREWRTAVRDCPQDEFIVPTEPDLPALRTEILELHAIESLPIPNNAVVRERVSTQEGRSLYLAAIYMQHGQVLSASYLSTTATPSKTQVDRLVSLAHIAGNRLVTLPGGDPA